VPGPENDHSPFSSAELKKPVQMNTFADDISDAGFFIGMFSFCMQALVFGYVLCSTYVPTINK
jgi:hypothetical protein